MIQDIGFRIKNKFGKRLIDALEIKNQDFLMRQSGDNSAENLLESFHAKTRAPS